MERSNPSPRHGPSEGPTITGKQLRTGVYVITCQPTGKQYVGSAATSFAQRWRQHRYSLRQGTHHSPQMQFAWSKYGESAFTFAVLVRCAADEVLAHEQRLIDTMRPTFNTAKVAGNTRGFRFTDAQLDQLRRRPQSTVRLYAFRGEQLSVPEIAKRLNVTPAGVYARLRSGGGVERSAGIIAPVEIAGRTMTPRQIAEEFALPLTTVYSRLRLGWTGAALTQPRKHRARNSRG